MAINPFWQNSFGANVADAGVDPSGLMAPPPTTGNGLFGLWQGLNADPTKRDALQAFAGQLLAGSGYGPRQSGSEVFGRALLASQAARAASLEQIQKKKLQDAQIAAANAKQSPFGNVDPAKYTPESISKFQTSGNYGDLIADPAALAGSTPADIQIYKFWSGLTAPEQQNFLRLKRNVGSDYQIVDVNGVPTVIYKPAAGMQPGSTGVPLANLVNGVPPGTPAGAPPAQAAPPLQTPLTTLPNQAAGAQRIKQAEATGSTTGTTQTTRYSTQIDNGLQAADSTAILRRGLELLDSVKTGGIDAAKLKATNLFGVTGADEAELSANLGKAVLSQLRSTFGSQFTEREGQRLQEIEAGFGKSTEGNRRLLDQAQKMVTRIAERGIRAAEASGDTETAQEIRDSLKFSIGEQKPSASGVPDDINSLLKQYGRKK